MGSSSKQTIGYWYKLGLHFAVCYGPVDALFRIVCGGREAWNGFVTENDTIEIDARDLFGGKKREGGIEGDLDVMMGGPAQTANAYLSDQIDGLMPAFRGVLSLVYKGGYISANNPYVKPWAFLVKRIEAGWDGGTAWYPETAAIENLLSGGADFAVFIESFDEGNLDNYTQVQGGNFPFSIVSNAIQVSTGVGHNVITRPLPNVGPVFRIRAKMTLVNVESDDAGSFGLRNSSSQIVFEIGTCRDATVDALRRPTCNFFDSSGLLQNPIGAGQLEIGEVYQFEADFDEASSTFACSLTKISDGSLFGSVDVLVGARPSANFLAFTNDDFHGAGTSIFDDIEIYVEAPLSSMNPAHIVYQSLTDPLWGMGYPVAQIDDTSFTEAADTFSAEGLGLCLIWNQQSSIEDFVQLVLDHAGAVLYADPKTGKFKLKALRADYDVDYLPVYDESNIISVDSFERPGYGETINEITVVYNEPTTGKDIPITVQDLANIQAQGGVVSQTRQYPGLPTAELAARIAERDVIASSTPLAKCKITVNRSAWEEAPGGVIKVNWDKLGIEAVVFRVLTINYGTLGNGQLVVELAEDVYGLPSSSYSTQEPAGFTEPDTSPTPITVQDVLEAPYWDVARTASAADLSFMDADTAFIEAVASTNNPVSLGYEMYTRISPAEYASADLTATFAPTALVAGSVGLIREAVSVIEYSDAVNIDDVVVGQRCLIGSGRFAEFAEITDIDTALAEITVNRGILDTTPQEHAIGTRIWFNEDDFAADPTERATGDEVDVKLSAFSGGGEIDIATATEMTIEPDQRFYRPYPPGKIRVNNEAYPDEITNDITVTWAHRDRLQQLASYVDQEEASIGPEASTTYNVRVYLDSDLVYTQNAISGTSSTLYTFVGPSGLGRVEVEAVRGGLVSWQMQERVFDVITGVASDPDFSLVKALLHLDGADGSTTITDVTGRAWTANGNAQIDTAQSVFGGASVLLDGSGDYLHTVHDAALSPNADYVFECRIRPSVINAIKCIATKRPSSGTATEFVFSITAANKLSLTAWTTGGVVVINIAGTTNIQQDVWQSVAISKSGTTWRIFLDGNVEASGTESGTYGANNQPFWIGRDPTVFPGRDFAGHIDEVRITKGTGSQRPYTAAYTPAGAAFPDF